MGEYFLYMFSFLHRAHFYVVEHPLFGFLAHFATLGAFVNDGADCFGAEITQHRFHIMVFKFNFIVLFRKSRVDFWFSHIST